LKKEKGCSTLSRENGYYIGGMKLSTEGGNIGWGGKERVSQGDEREGDEVGRREKKKN